MGRQSTPRKNPWALDPSASGDGRKRSAFVDWVNGDRILHLSAALHEPRERRKRPILVFNEEKMAAQLVQFFRRYHMATTLMCAVLLVIFAWVVITLPRFGDSAAPANNELPAVYLTEGPVETGADNAVTAMIFTYRGFDTLGESCVLFLALSSVMMLLRREDGSMLSAQERTALAKAAAAEPKTRNYIIVQMSRILVPFIFLYGLYVLLGGESSPGGGFSAGAILSAGIILYRHAFGSEATERFMNERVFVAVRTVGLCIYAVLFGAYILLPDDVKSHLTAHLIMPIDVAVGMVVMCTMYGIYALFIRGEI